jgi:hypothetical protein
MGTISANWTLIASNARLQRSSQTLSITGTQALVFGGELLARQPVDNRIDLIELGHEGQGKVKANLLRLPCLNAVKALEAILGFCLHHLKHHLHVLGLQQLL